MSTPSARWSGTRNGSFRTDRSWRHIKADGSAIDVEAYSQSLQYEGRPAWMVAVVDITERKKANEELRRTRQFLDTVIENVPAMLFVKEAKEHRYILMNRAGEELLGIPRDELIGKTDYDFLPQEEADSFFIRDQEVLRADRLHIVEEETHPHPPQRGARHPDEAAFGRWRRWRIQIPARRRRGHNGAQARGGADRPPCQSRCARPTCRIARLSPNASTSPSSERPPRRIRSRCCASTSTASRTSTTCSATRPATRCCTTWARRLAAAAGGAFLARVGGDEFTLIVDGPQPDTAIALADRLMATVADDFQFEGHTFRIGLSIGMAFFPNDGTNAATLLSNADAALYRAKADGRGVFRMFEADMDKRLRERRGLQKDLQSAIQRNELSLDYQPQALISGEIIGFEALVRWHHPTHGLIGPMDFIPLAEESGLIIPIGEWILREACREAASWPNPIQIAVNLSPVQFRHGDLPGLIHTVLLETGLAPGRLELEITESVLFDDFSRASSILRRLKALGVRIAMDDFGTGYSSLSYLQSFPFDKIKIDQSFMR